eukprot:CAMPEP_0114437116 /NCGR_PEP_ID=MMETSP0103-20121206/13832_1 /TAXON_ID=37642 ORGANISM="Paraphysomonas imperforata, Strain PA2" /NCGR_SAMPLE_ID=MMETSP0103 /ASSEMBLY_ACC=CAM_ASM_000201 /LENGTH=334 /DNA_ID=CAMNT_0001607467 /DNA_START=113 /DNA_END=1116 /DNA_ORIENTATION=+
MSKPRTPASTKQHFIAGTSAGIVTAALLYPIDLVKVRYQVYDKTGNAYRSLYGAFKTIVHEEGVRGLFNGLAPAPLASAVSWGGYLYFYEHAKKRKLHQLNGSEVDTTAQLNTVDHLLSGVEAGVYMVFITNPLWLIKTRLQIQHNPLPGQTSEAMSSTGVSGTGYKGPLDAVRVIMREEGVAGFYRGLIPALLLTSHGAVQFAVYEQLKASFKELQDHSEKHNQPALVSMVTGVTSKIVASTLTYPYQVIKSRLQQRGELRPVAQSSGEVIMVPQPKYSGVIHCASQILRGEGLRGFFRGLVPNCMKVAPSAAVTFLVYEETLKLLSHYQMGR